MKSNSLLLVLLTVWHESPRIIKSNAKSRLKQNESHHRIGRTVILGQRRRIRYSNCSFYKSVETKGKHMRISTFISTFLLTLILCTAALAIEPVNPNLNPTARKILEYLDSIYGQRVLSGYNVYVHTPDDYEQTAKHAAIWGRDIKWLGDSKEMAAHAKRRGYILTLHWHWYFDNDSAWSGKRKRPVDVGKMVTPGTAENTQTMKEIAAAADKLQVFEDADVPVLWRPLHEIDGGWFWWTDKKNPENTAKLWRMMFDYMTKTRKLDNLIWVYSAGVGNKALEYRKDFYPGPEYVDISGIDVYGVEYKTDTEKYRNYFDMMARVSPGKMLACGEGDAIPDPEKMQSGKSPKWLYVLPWWGAPSGRRPADWALFTMRHDFIITLDELPPFGTTNIAPHIGITAPLDDGSAWFTDKSPLIEAYAKDRDGAVTKVEFFANDRLLATDTSAPYSLRWTSAKPGCYDVTARATDNKGLQTTSNNIRLNVGLIDLALNKPVAASSGKSAENAVDGNYYTAWSADKSEDAWIYVDLGATQKVDRVNLLWGWKIHATEFDIDIAITNPQNTENWTTVHSESNLPYKTWEATHRTRFAPVTARYVRLHAKRRAGNQTWAGYNLTALEVPVLSQHR